jgi:hypothetical protein
MSNLNTCKSHPATVRVAGDVWRCICGRYLAENVRPIPEPSPVVRLLGTLERVTR